MGLEKWGHDMAAPIAARSPRLAGFLMSLLGVALFLLNGAFLYFNGTFYPFVLALGSAIIAIGGWVMVTGISASPVRGKPPLWWNIGASVFGLTGLVVGLWLSKSLKEAPQEATPAQGAEWEGGTAPGGTTPPVIRLAATSLALGTSELSLEHSGEFRAISWLSKTLAGSHGAVARPQAEAAAAVDSAPPFQLLLAPDVRGSELHSVMISAAEVGYVDSLLGSSNVHLVTRSDYFMPREMPPYGTQLLLVGFRQDKVDLARFHSQGRGFSPVAEIPYANFAAQVGETIDKVCAEVPCNPLLVEIEHDQPVDHLKDFLDLLSERLDRRNPLWAVLVMRRDQY